MMLIIVALLTLAIAALIMAASKILDHVKRLEKRIRTLEHLAGLDAFPPTHPMCRCTTFSDRGLSEPDRPVIKRGGRNG